MKKLNYLLLVSFVCFVLLSMVGPVRLEVNQLEPTLREYSDAWRVNIVEFYGVRNA